jgi:hypothetical protein
MVSKQCCDMDGEPLHGQVKKCEAGTAVPAIGSLLKRLRDCI